MAARKTVPITGASSGIGPFTAHHLARRGFHVARVGPRCTPLQLDVADPAARERAILRRLRAAVLA
jgi:NAD(P)-dependent dehydrogenase (short-subunit alcohol dehydrogenase family)